MTACDAYLAKTGISDADRGGVALPLLSQIAHAFSWRTARCQSHLYGTDHVSGNSQFNSVPSPFLVLSAAGGTCYLYVNPPSTLIIDLPFSDAIVIELADPQMYLRLAEGLISLERHVFGREREPITAAQWLRRLHVAWEL